jgi:hypothetical protein
MFIKALLVIWIAYLSKWVDTSEIYRVVKSVRFIYLLIFKIYNILYVGNSAAFPCNYEKPILSFLGRKWAKPYPPLLDFYSVLWVNPRVPKKPSLPHWVLGQTANSEKFSISELAQPLKIPCKSRLFFLVAPIIRLIPDLLLKGF